MSYAEKIILADIAGTVADVTASNALKVDGSAVTQPVSVASLPLPTGAALEATLQNIKTAVEIIDNFISGSKGLVTEDNSAAIKTAVETIDNFISGSRGLVTEDNSAAILTALGTIITALAGTLTVSGTVTANAGTNLNTSALALEATLQSVKTAVETIDNAIAGSEMQVDVVSSALPSGAATSANQSTIIGHVDGIETTLGTIDADTGNISTKIDTIAGAVSGLEMQVDVVTMPTVTVQATDLDIRDLVFATDKVDASGTVLGSGTNYIGKVRITDGTTDAEVVPLTGYNAQAVAIVDSSGNQITSFGGGTQYTEDVASAADPIGNALIARRRDSLAAETTTDGDNTALNSTSKGELYVKHVDTIPVTDNGGSITVDAVSLPLPTGAATEATLSTIDADTSNISTKIDTIAGAVSGTEMQVDVLTMPTVTVQSTNLDIRDLTFAGDKVDASGTTLGANSGVDIGDVTINNASGGSAVNIQDGGNSITVDNGGTFVTQENGPALTSLQLIDDAIIADDSPFTPATTKVMMAGFEYDDTATDSINEGDAGAARMSANRNVYMQIRDAAGNERGANVNASNELKVDASGQYIPVSGVLTNKTPNVTYISQQQVAANGVVVGSARTMVYAKNAVIGIWFGRRSATASTGPVNFRIEGNNTYGGSTGYWTPITTYTTNYAAVEAEAVSGTANAGATTINVASTTNLLVGDIVYFDNGTAGNSEWHRIKSLVTNTSITLEEALSNAQTGSTIYNGAEITTTGPIDTLGYYYIRVVVDGAQFTQNYMVKCFGSYSY